MYGDVSARSSFRPFPTITKKKHFISNYELRSLEAPNLPDSHKANKIGDAIDDRISAQVFAAF